MTIENWVDLLAPIISALVAVVSASLAYVFAKKQQVTAAERRLKEKYYLNYIEAVSKEVIYNNSPIAHRQLADAQNQLLLIGGPEVVAKLMVFDDYIKPSNRGKYVFEKQNELLTDLLKSMRSDLYKNHKVNDGYPAIYLVGRPPEK